MKVQKKRFPIPWQDCREYPILGDMILESRGSRKVPEAVKESLGSANVIRITSPASDRAFQRARVEPDLEPLYSLAQSLVTPQQYESDAVARAYVDPLLREAETRLETLAAQITFKVKTPDPLTEDCLFRIGTLLIPKKQGFFRFEYRVTEDDLGRGITTRAEFERHEDVTTTNQRDAALRVYDEGKLSSVVMAFATAARLNVTKTILPVFAYKHLV